MMRASGDRVLMVVVSLLVVAIASYPPAQAQQAARVPRVGILSEGDSGPDPTRKVFEDGLREHGYVSGTNVVIERRFAEGRLERLAELAAELVRLPVDVIVAPSERGAVAAKQATTAIPIVMVLGIDPVRQGADPCAGTPGRERDRTHGRSRS